MAEIIIETETDTEVVVEQEGPPGPPGPPGERGPAAEDLEIPDLTLIFEGALL